MLIKYLFAPIKRLIVRNNLSPNFPVALGQYKAPPGAPPD